MTYGNEDSGLLKDIIEFFFEHGEDNCYSVSEIETRLREEGRTEKLTGFTPGQTVGSYLSQNKDIFHPTTMSPEEAAYGMRTDAQARLALKYGKKSV